MSNPALEFPKIHLDRVLEFQLLSVGVLPCSAMLPQAQAAKAAQLQRQQEIRVGEADKCWMERNQLKN